MNRMLTVLALLAMVFASAVPVGAAERAVTLQRTVMVVVGVERLSDVFTGIEAAGDAELIYAPEPGQR